MCSPPGFGQERNSGASPESSRETFRLLSDTKTQAADLQRDSSYLESFTHSSELSWQSHFEQLADMEFRINRIGVDLPPKMRHLVKTQNPMNGELSHGNVSQAVHEGV
jgi:hypothetical protein